MRHSAKSYGSSRGPSRVLPMTDTKGLKQPGTQKCRVNQRPKVRKRWHEVKAPIHRRARNTP